MKCSHIATEALLVCKEHNNNTDTKKKDILQTVKKEVCKEIVEDRLQTYVVTYTLLKRSLHIGSKEKI